MVLKGWSHRGGGGCRGDNMNLQNSGAINSVPLLKHERTNHVWYPIIAHVKQQALAMPTVHLHESLKTPNKLRTTPSYRI